MQNYFIQVIWNYTNDKKLHSLKLRSHCRAIRYERHNCTFVADRGGSLKFKVLIQSDAGQYVLIRFVALECDMITIAQFLMTRSATIWSLLQILSDTFGQDCPDRVHDRVQT